MTLENLFGRLLTQAEVRLTVNQDTEQIPGPVQKIPGMTVISPSKIVCNRCESKYFKKDVRLPLGVYYCPSCLFLGRVRSDQFLYHLPQQVFSPSSSLSWNGKLTPYQQNISDQLVTLMKNKKEVLVEAVTGAGKTEMTYAAINDSLMAGGCIGIASPRVDVLLELHTRLSRDFDLTIPLLHAQGEPYFPSPLILLTTHQLLRFKHAFDLLIIDEVDAFPFSDSLLLYRAAKNSRKTQSACLILTATSTKYLDRQIQSKQLIKLSLSRRFHGYPLVVPKNVWYTQFDTLLNKQRLTGFPLLIFAPEIHLGKKLANQLQNQIPHEKIGFVASISRDRKELVEAFRIRKVSILVSTTILERGVTFPKVDVFVFKAHHRTFTKSALIQIAGRVGRSQDRPTGLVYFFHEGISQSMINARKAIQTMNRVGYSDDLSHL